MTDSVEQLILDILDLGIQVWADDEKLHFRGAKKNLTGELREHLVASKSQLMERLGSRRKWTPASFAQERTWLLNQLGPRNGVDNINTAWTVRGELDVQSLQKSLDTLSQRHEVLRAYFEPIRETPVQIIALDPPPPQWPRVDLGDLSEDDAEKALRRLFDHELCRPMDLGSGPLLRTFLVVRNNTDDSETIVFLQLHHIISDGWSQNILETELWNFYENWRNGTPPSPEPLPVQYADFAARERHQGNTALLKNDLDYWRHQLADIEGLTELAPDLPRPNVSSYRGARIPVDFQGIIPSQLEDISQRHQASLYMWLVSAYFVLHHRLSNQQDLLVGMPVAHRLQEDLEPLIGYFVNSLVLRTRIEPSLRFTEVVERSRTSVIDALAHQNLPFEKLVKELNPERDPSRTPYFQIVFLLHHISQRPQAPGIEVRELELSSPRSNFDLAFHLYQTQNKLTGDLVFNTDLYHASTMQRLVRQYTDLLRLVTENPEIRLSDIPLVTPSERHQLLYELPSTRQAPPVARLAHEIFSEHARRAPQRVALTYDGVSMSYGELDNKAGQLARLLCQKGVRPEDRVALFLERSSDLIVGLLAILKAGAAYIPLDPTLPNDRLAMIIDDVRCRLIMTHGSLEKRLMETEMANGVPTLCLSSEAFDKLPPLPPVPIGMDHAAYVIYTSGSTGKPKGVTISHRNILWLIHSSERVFRPSSEDVWTLFHSIGFDFSVWEIWGALAHGGRLVVVPYLVSRSPEDFCTLLEKEKVTVLNQTPSAFRMLTPAATERRWSFVIRWVIFGGETLDTAMLDGWFRLYAENGLRVVNGYGITETTVFVTFRPVVLKDLKRYDVSPIGLQLDDSQVYVLQEDLQPAPFGCVGELMVGGPGLGRGYLHRPRLTAMRFIPHPWDSNAPGERLYRSGDLARWQADGELVFLGRNDFQVKIRGFRIELGEIEAVLRDHDEIRDTAVLTRSDNGGSDNGGSGNSGSGNGGSKSGERIVAYLIPRDPSANPEELASTVDEEARKVLPGYMMPSDYACLEAFPLNSSGKLHRKKLLATPTFSLSGAVGGGLAEPRDEPERRMAAIWREVLDQEEVGIHDNFFSRGGDSILSIQIVTRANRNGFSLTPSDLFQYQTVAELARHGNRGAIRTILVEEATSPVPVTPIQNIFLQRQQKETAHFNWSALLQPQTVVSAAALRQAFRRLAQRHDALRLRFLLNEGGSWAQEVQEATDLFHHIDLSRIEERQRRQTIEKASQQLQRSLDIHQGPLARFAFYDTGDAATQRLLVITHHLVIDAVSWQILFSDLELLLAASAATTLPSRTTPLTAWTPRLATHPEVLQEVESWNPWRERFRGLAQASAGHADKSIRNELRFFETHEASLDRPQTEALGASDIAAKILAALASSYRQIFGRDELALLFEGHGRRELGQDIDLTRTIGWFTGLYPMILETTIIETTKEQLLETVRRQVHDMPRRLLGYGLLPDSHREMPEIAFNYLGQLQSSDSPSGQDNAVFRVVDEPHGDPMSPWTDLGHSLLINGGLEEGRLRLSWTYHRDVLTAEEIQRWASLSLEFLAQRNAESDGAEEGHDAAESYDAEESYPLSPRQLEMLQATLNDPSRTTHTTQTTWLIDNGLDRQAFRETWRTIAARHPVLCTVFEGRVDPPRQIVRSSMPFAWLDEDWRQDGTEVSKERRGALLDDFLVRDRDQGFDLSEGPMVRFHLAQLGSESYVFTQTIHHIVLDGWSQEVLYREMRQLYKAHCANRTLELPTPQPYSKYIRWLQENKDPDAETFWRERMAGFRNPTLLAQNDRSSRDSRSIQGRDVQQEVIRLDRGATERILLFAREERLTANTVAQGAWAQTLGEHLGVDEVVFGTTLSGRPTTLEGSEDIVGLLINSIPLRARLEDNSNVSDWLRTLQSQHAAAREKGSVSSTTIKSWCGVPQDQPLFDTALVFENFPAQEDPDDPIQVTEARFRSVSTTTLNLLVVPEENGWEILANYNASAVSASTVSHLLEQFRKKLFEMRSQGD